MDSSKLSTAYGFFTVLIKHDRRVIFCTIAAADTTINVINICNAGNKLITKQRAQQVLR